ncbi:SDR family NAD(P)-dependent oxidoreductase [Phenylobacterium sp.]|uniref:SDR family NAD(P)-dependent oxidoreductase n=1 Tax=Phenylobacterium sp. TaxID=1871053 RepID=UPI002623DCF7|nr:SDR family NAD(P)-dependent oxidoreductase [Phenylobacterium sp.]
MNQVVLITGGTSGIGWALAEAALARGDAVAVCGRSTPALERFADRYPQALAVRCDVTVGADRVALLKAVADRFGRLDILISNAGTFVERDFATDPAATQDLEAEVALNLTAPIQLTHEALSQFPALRAIVLVTSGFALVSPTRAPTYGAVKAGLHGFAEGLRRQLAPRGVHVLELLPPATDTPMNASLPGKKMSPAAVAAETLDGLERGRSMVLPGPAKPLPLLLRIAPAAVRRMVASM